MTDIGILTPIILTVNTSPDYRIRNFLIKNSEGEILAITPQDNTKRRRAGAIHRGYWSSVYL